MYRSRFLFLEADVVLRPIFDFLRVVRSELPIFIFFTELSFTGCIFLCLHHSVRTFMNAMRVHECTYVQVSY